VSDTLPCSLIGFHPMTNSMWVTLLLFYYHEVSLHFIPWPTECGWHCFFFFTMQSHCISSYDQQQVSDTAFYSLPSSLIDEQQYVSDTAFISITMHSDCISSHDQQEVSDTAFSLLPCSLIALHLITNRMWVILLFFYYHAVSLHFIPWLTGCE